MSANEQGLVALQQKIWNGSLPLEIRLSRGECRTFDDSDSYFVQVPRLSYLPFLLPRLYAFFRTYLIDPEGSVPYDGWFSSEGVPLKWHFPVGLLFDIYAGNEPASAGLEPRSSSPRGSRPQWRPGSRNDSAPGAAENTPPSEAVHRATIGEVTEHSDDSQDSDKLPWAITVHFTDWPSEHLPSQAGEDGAALLDAFRNQLKESSYVRHSTNKPVFGLSYEDSTGLWDAVKRHDLPLFRPINDKLLRPPGMSVKGIPMRLYLPHAPDAPSGAVPAVGEGDEVAEQQTGAGTLHVVQAPVSPYVGSGGSGSGSRQTPQTLGTALNTLLPSLFPSRRSPLLALPVLHGAVVPLSASLEELSRAASYADGWLHVVIKMMS